MATRILPRTTDSLMPPQQLSLDAPRPPPHHLLFSRPPARTIRLQTQLRKPLQPSPQQCPAERKPVATCVQATYHHQSVGAARHRQRTHRACEEPDIAASVLQRLVYSVGRADNMYTGHWGSEMR